MSSRRPQALASRALAPAVACALLAMSGLAAAQPEGRKEAAPKELDGVGVTEKLGAHLPQALEFTDSDGKQVALGELIHGDRPVLLTLNYSDCPMLCSLQLNGMVEALNGVDWQLGKNFDLITVSLDPKETVERARQTKARYLKQYSKGDALAAERGWTFLVGTEANVQALADVVGFGYRYSEERQEYLHQAALMVLTPSGTVSRYLYGIAFSPQTVRLSMVEASEGKQVSTLDALVLYCFHYDAEAGNYSPVVRNIMKLGGAITVVGLAFFVAAGFTVKKHRKKVSNTPANGVA
jgi:protein SCO1/2